MIRKKSLSIAVNLRWIDKKCTNISELYYRAYNDEGEKTWGKNLTKIFPVGFKSKSFFIHMCKRNNVSFLFWIQMPSKVYDKKSFIVFIMFSEYIFVTYFLPLWFYCLNPLSHNLQDVEGNPKAKSRTQLNIILFLPKCWLKLKKLSNSLFKEESLGFHRWVCFLFNNRFNTTGIKWNTFLTIQSYFHRCTQCCDSILSPSLIWSIFLLSHSILDFKTKAHLLYYFLSFRTFTGFRYIVNNSVRNVMKWFYEFFM